MTKFLLSFLLLSACAAVDLTDHLAAEADFHANQEYLFLLSQGKVFRPEVYSDDEFLADCEFYQMPECFK